MVWSGLEKALNYGFDNWDAVNQHPFSCLQGNISMVTNKQTTNQPTKQVNL